MNLVNLFIISVIEKYVDFSDMIINNTNFKDQLLKYFQHNYKSNPIYETTKISDNKYSTIIKQVKDEKQITISNHISTSKKKSEQLAAKLALIKYHVISD